MKLSNEKMEAMIASCKNLLQRTDIIGYASAKNCHTFRDHIAEFIEIKERLVREHGTPQLDENGNGTGFFKISPDMKGYQEVIQKILKLAAIESEVNIFKIPISEVKGKLTGSEMLEIEWMIDWEDDKED